MKFMVETSARHVHLSTTDLAALFGEGYELTKKKDLSQPGQYACEERVTIVGPKKELKGVSVLGPVRKQTQVELSMTDARSIGIAAPIRESGVLDGSGPCKIIGPAGEIDRCTAPYPCHGGRCRGAGCKERGHCFCKD